MSLPRGVLEKYITPDCIFIECGSRWGDTLLRARELGAFHAVGCEADNLYAHLGEAHVKEKFSLCSVLHMKSTFFLQATWDNDRKDKIVFLDAHTESSSPVMEELELLDKWEQKPKVILIDDLRCMQGWGVLVDRLQGKLLDMGYRVGYEDGVEPRDIMVGVMP